MRWGVGKSGFKTGWLPHTYMLSLVIGIGIIHCVGRCVYGVNRAGAGGGEDWDGGLL